MKTLRSGVMSAAVALVLIAPSLLAPSAVEAYDIFLTEWNVTQLEAAGDKVKVTISGNTMTLTWIDGNGGIDPDATNLKSIFWSDAVRNAAGTAAGTGDYSKINVCGGTGCRADGFGKFRVDVDDANPSSKTLTVTFTFANNLDGTAFTASDFALHVQYSNDCSGFVSGRPGGPGNSNANCAAAVPEPMTVFLGGTGLLALGYFGRTRLFRRFAT